MPNILFHFFLGYKISQQPDKVKAIIGIISSFIFGIFSAIIVLTNGGSNLPDKGNYIELNSNLKKCTATTKGWKNKRKILSIYLENYPKTIEYFEHVGILNDLLDQSYMNSLLDACNKGESVKIKIREYGNSSDLVAVYSKNKGTYILPVDHKNSDYKFSFWLFLFFLILSIAIFLHSLRYLIDPKDKNFDGKLLETKTSTANDDESKIKKPNSDKNNLTSISIIDLSHEQKSKDINPKKPLKNKSDKKTYKLSSSRNSESDKKENKFSKGKSSNIAAIKSPTYHLDSNNHLQKETNPEKPKQFPNSRAGFEIEKKQSITEMADALRDFRLKLEREGIITSKKRKKPDN